MIHKYNLYIYIVSFCTRMCTGGKQYPLVGLGRINYMCLLIVKSFYDNNAQSKITRD